MSGGVDSAVAAWLLQEKGFRVQGLFIRMTGTEKEEQALSSARAVSDILGIRLHIADMQKEFRHRVLEYFLDAYRSCKTPNPCVICNPDIKIASALAIASNLGIQLIATGHYARRKITAGGRAFLMTARHSPKDQSYFLHQLNKKVLGHLIMPLGGLDRKTVENISKEAGINSHIQEESQDICFLRGDYRKYIRQMPGMSPVPGPIVKTDGTIAGEHKGLVDYTVGQRRGLGIPDKTPYYVIHLDHRSNTLVIGKKHELLKKSCLVSGINWLAEPGMAICSSLQVKLRSRHKPVKASVQISRKDNRTAIVCFQEAQHAVTPGQFAVFYKGPLVIGGGTICK